MLRQLFSGSFSKELLIQFLLSIPVILLSLSVHESVHAITAHLLGDDTARNLGRITLNPKKHFDIIGFLAMLLLGFGWANPVPVNSRNLKNPRRDFVIIALAGPLSNIILAFIFAFLYYVSGMLYFSHNHMALYVLMLFFGIGVSINVSWAVFNLIPIPPLDGSRLLTALIPQKLAMWFFRNERKIEALLFVLLFLGAFTNIISSLTGTIGNFIFRVVGKLPFEKFLH